MKRTLNLGTLKEGMRFMTFITLWVLSVGLLAAQDNDSLGIDFNIVSVPSNPTIGDSICYEWKVTNYTGDTLTNVMLIDDAVVNVAVPELLPFGQMSASGSSLTGSGSFMFTGSGCALLTPMDLNRGFKTFKGRVTSEDPAYTSCTTGYVCFGVTFSCIDMNVSVNSKCETLLTPRLMNVNSTLPDSVIRIRIQELDGSYRYPAYVGVDDVGKKLKVVVDAPVCGADAAPCWSYANIEYKLGPEIICSSDTISCAENVAMNEPIVVDACGSTEFIRLATTRTDLCRVDSMFLAVDTVVYAVRDQFGNVSDTCRQLRYIKKPNLTRDDIVFPGDATVSCDAAIFDADGKLPIDFTGVPTWDGVSLLEINRASCNVFAELVDLLDVSMPCNNADKATRRITRQWIVYEWKCEGGVTEIRSEPFTITFIDNTPPIISELPGTLNYSVDDFECLASFLPPTATVYDVCNDIGTTLEYRFLGQIYPNEGQIVKLPIGVHNLEYIARDACGNEAIDTIEVTVEDRSIPVAICLKENTVSITDRSAFIRATDIDQDSYDPCGIDSIKIRRRTSLCNPDDVEWQDFVEFCCEDIGTDVEVGLRVWDSNGNWNECWINVFVKGGATATVTCIPDTIVMTCEYTYDENDPSSLEIFGIIERDLNPDSIILPSELFVRASGPLVNGTLSENCGVSIVELPPVVNIDSICRTGTIDRLIEVTDASGTVTQCRQRIIIQGDQNANPATWAYTPPNDTITGLDGRTVASIAIDDPARGVNNGCSLVGVGYYDRTYRLDSSSLFCAKVIREWHLVDWCRNGVVPVDTYYQHIFVDDTEPPVISPLTSQSVVLPAAINVNVTDAVASSILDLSISFTILGSGGSYSQTLSEFDASTTFFENPPGVADRAEFILPEGILPLGDYTLTWTVSDPCGNEAVTSQDLSIVNSFRTTDVVGQVLFANGGVMDKVQVYLTEEEGMLTTGTMDITDNDGEYGFNQAELGQSYYVDPRKNDDLLNGVTTLDILKIQRHILGITTIDEPRLKIAADVNNDGKITIFDLLELRKAIMGKSTSFSNNESWTFFYEGQNLEDIFIYGDQMMRRYYIPTLENQMSINFEGIKIGDVSGDAIGHSAGLAGGRSYDEISLVYETRQIDNESHILIMSDEYTTISGLQAQWSVNFGQPISRVLSGRLKINGDEIYRNNEQGTLRMSITSESDISISKGDVLFSIVLQQRADGALSVDESWFDAEIYTPSGIKRIQLNAVSKAEDGGILSVSQNIPNPWSERTVISVEIPQSGDVSLTIYDLQSRIIYRETRTVEKGIQKFEIDSEKVLEAGMYFYEVQAAGQRAHQKMLRVD